MKNSKRGGLLAPLSLLAIAGCAPHPTDHTAAECDPDRLAFDPEEVRMRTATTYDGRKSYALAEEGASVQSVNVLWAGRTATVRALPCSHGDVSVERREDVGGSGVLPRFDVVFPEPRFLESGEWVTIHMVGEGTKKRLSHFRSVVD